MRCLVFDCSLGDACAVRCSVFAAGRNDPLDCPSSSPSSCAELYGPVLSTIPSLSESLERMSISRGSTGDAASASLPKFVWFSNVTVPRRPRRSRSSESLGIHCTNQLLYRVFDCAALEGPKPLLAADGTGKRPYVVQLIPGWELALGGEGWL